MLELLNGNEAAAEGARLSRPQVILTCPVTTMAPILTKISKDIGEKRLEAEPIHVAVECEAEPEKQGS
jgi:pyruvate ferredoxin oxidoreductase alpha subunit